MVTAMPPIVPICRSRTARSGSAASDRRDDLLARPADRDRGVRALERGSDLVEDPVGVGGDQVVRHAVTLPKPLRRARRARPSPPSTLRPARGVRHVGWEVGREAGFSAATVARRARTGRGHDRGRERGASRGRPVEDLASSPSRDQRVDSANRCVPISARPSRSWTSERRNGTVTIGAGATWPARPAELRLLAARPPGGSRPGWPTAPPSGGAGVTSAWPRGGRRRRRRRTSGASG